MEHEDFHGLFPVPDLWRPSILTVLENDEASLFSPLELDVTKINLENPYAPKTNLENELQLPGIEAFVYGKLETIDLPDESILSSEPEHEARRAEEEEDGHDIWDVNSDVWSVKDQQKHLTWETFIEPERVEEPSAYISEAGPATFDAAVQVFTETSGLTHAAATVMQADVVLKSLYDLGLGRSSVLFAYDGKRKTFVPLVENMTSTGYSGASFKGLKDRMVACGTAVKRLRNFAEKTYASGPFPGKVALANAISIILSALEAFLSDQRRLVRTLIQLQHVFDRPHQILMEVLDMVKSLRGARTDESLTSIMFKRCQHFEQEADWLRSIMFAILARVSKPLLEVWDRWVGFKTDLEPSVGVENQAISFIGSESLQPDEEAARDGTTFVFRPQAVPNFVSKDDAQMIFEIGQGLRLLRSHNPSHPLAASTVQPRETLSLEWKFGWKDMDAVVEKAKRYEEVLLKCLKDLQIGKSTSTTKRTILARYSPPTYSTGFNGDYELSFKSSLARLDETLPTKPSLPDELFQIILSRLEPPLEYETELATFEPPLTVTPILSFSPLITTQARLMNGACLRLFLHSHNLRKHLNLLRVFPLMGDGVFVSRLTAALFDPSLSATERQLGVMRSGTGMGLKLGDRSTWPPASSELRLALMGILSECYRSSRLIYGGKNGKSEQLQDLPGSLSFAIRQVTEDEAEKVMDPHSLHALDFLRLQYSPPSPIDAVITTASLDKYDTIFKLLLRDTRLLFVVSHLPRRIASATERLFIQQATVFVNGCAQYFFETGIRQTWESFDAYLDQVEHHLAMEDGQHEPRPSSSVVAVVVIGGIEDLRKRHEACLDRMLFALLLRNRQQKVMALLEEIFGIILEFEKLCGPADAKDRAGHHAVRLQREFSDKVGVFLEVCKGLVGKKGYGTVGSSSTGKEDNTIERLLLALDTDGWYSSTTRRR